MFKYQESTALGIIVHVKGVKLRSVLPNMKLKLESLKKIDFIIILWLKKIQKSKCGAMIIHIKWKPYLNMHIDGP